MLSRKWILSITVSISVIAIVVFYSASLLTQTLLFVGACIALNGLIFILFNKNSRTFLPKESQSNKVNILLVDDSKASRRITIEILNPFKLNIVEAENGSQAIELYQKQPFSLILMDLEMNDVNGIDVVKKIRLSEDKEKRLPIIAISAHSSDEKKLEALVAGFDEYLSKPLMGKDLIQTLNRWLNKAIAKKEKTAYTHKNVAFEDKHPTETETSISQRQEDVTLEFLKEKSTDNSGTIKKIVDVKQSLVFSRNNHDLAKDMLSLLIELIVEERKNIENLFQEQKWKELGAIVHKINGGSCYCGVPELQKQTQKIDSAIDNNKIDIVEECFPCFIKSIDELIHWNDEHELDIIFGQ